MAEHYIFREGDWANEYRLECDGETFAHKTFCIDELTSGKIHAWAHEEMEKHVAEKHADVPFKRDVMTQVLIYHQQTNTSGCHCGWGNEPEHLGRSWAEHVVGIYEDTIKMEE